MTTTDPSAAHFQRVDDDRGVATVMIALLTVTLLVFAALAIDLGQAYSQRRQMQNAADSATMAGTRAIDKVRFSGAAPSTIYTAIQTSVTDHLQNQTGANHCWLIDATKNRLTGDLCASPSVMTAGYNSVAANPVAGVEVQPSQTRNTFLARVVGFNTTTASASAAATIQPYLGGAGSPFITCGVPGVNPDAYSILDSAGNLLAGATTLTSIPVQGSQNHTCGAGSAFKGKNNSDQILVGVPCSGGGPPWATPCDMAWGDNGNGFSANIRDIVAGAVPCPANGPYTGCDILVPVADQGSGNGNSIQMHVAGWVVMHITGDGHGNPKYYGDVLAPGVVSSGQGGTGNVTGNIVRVIKLVR
jgi:Flp pilus assembly protein TadG